MKKILAIILIVFCCLENSSVRGANSISTTNSNTSSIQNHKIRELCKEAQNIEQQISKLEIEIDSLNQQERNTAPILKSTYEIIARCFTLLFDLQRFSKLLVVGQCNNKNDFVRCSIIIKNFSTYFKTVSEQLSVNATAIINIKRQRSEKLNKLTLLKTKYMKLREQISGELTLIPRTDEESIIKNVVYHIATKSNSLDELDAELESENAVGVLKNTKINTDLLLIYPAVGKIVAEFGDKGENGEMVNFLAFETRNDAIVVSPAKGLVVFSGKFLNYGNMVIISNGEYRVFLYGIGDNVYTNTGDIVEIGDYIGTMNSLVNRPVVKIELKKSGEALDPRHWLLQTIDKKGSHFGGERKI
ncbi:MAG: peptidoglycan DD-metalloendopeptidase family protein [Alphaproteobacteria bacterium]|nr:peptidoglycan DD-metalloendopeptidase family protein [Alphaproteobacteria bacterium]